MRAIRELERSIVRRSLAPGKQGLPVEGLC